MQQQPVASQVTTPCSLHSPTSPEEKERERLSATQLRGRVEERGFHPQESTPPQLATTLSAGDCPNAPCMVLSAESPLSVSLGWRASCGCLSTRGALWERRQVVVQFPCDRSPGRSPHSLCKVAVSPVVEECPRSGCDTRGLAKCRWIRMASRNGN